MKRQKHDVVRSNCTSESDPSKHTCSLVVLLSQSIKFTWNRNTHQVQLTEIVGKYIPSTSTSAVRTWSSLTEVWLTCFTLLSSSSIWWWTLWDSTSCSWTSQQQTGSQSDVCTQVSRKYVVPRLTCSLLISRRASMCSFLSRSISSRSSESDSDGCTQMNADVFVSTSFYTTFIYQQCWRIRQVCDYE